MNRSLDNIIWSSLAGSHAAFAVGTVKARRYATGFSPLMGFYDPTAPEFTDLAPHCVSGDRLYSEGWSGNVPDGWCIVLEAPMMQMIWQGEMPDTDVAPDAIRLGPEAAASALELAVLTNPGPFGIRTIEMGGYFGVFDKERLVAMAGERLYDGYFHEISGVCTHPDYRGQGHASRLMRKLILRQMQRGELPFLHVMMANTGARDLYERMGFRAHRETILRVVQRL